MADKLPVLKAREIMRVLFSLGFEHKRQSGSHIFFQHQDGRTTTIPIHGGKDISGNLLRKILNDTGISSEDFTEYL